VTTHRLKGYEVIALVITRHKTISNMTMTSNNKLELTFRTLTVPLKIG